ncbi:Dephospho-CoA kinase [Entamoeba marina]
MTYVVGITGRICSGKSTLSKVFENRGIPVIDCDKLGHELYLKGSIVYNKFIELFGDTIIGDDGNIVRSKVSQLVFNNPEKLKALSDMSWPAIHELLLKRIEEYKLKGYSVIGVEAALMIKVDWSCINTIWSTKINEIDTIQRLKIRNGISEEDAIKRIQSQPKQEEYDSKSNIIFENNGTVEELYKKVNISIDELLQHLKENKK